MKIIVITGGIASGKSTALIFMQQKNHAIIDCDTISKRVFHNCEKRIITALGPRVLKNNRIYRPYVRELIFSNKDARHKLEKIIHPRVYFRVAIEIFKYFICNRGVVFIEVPLFFECGLDRFVDSILVYCTREIQMERIIHRDGMMNLKEILNTQMCIEKKKAKATYIIENNISIDNLKDSISKLKIMGNKLTDYLLIVTLLIIISNCN